MQKCKNHQAERNFGVAGLVRTIKVGACRVIALLLFAGIMAVPASAADTPIKAVTLSERLVVDLPNGVKLELLKIEAGSFMMSRRDGENYDNETEHRVTLTRDFYLGKTEVTQAQWQAIMGTTVYAQRNKADKSWYLHGVGNDYPMYYVAWNDAMRFCDELNRRGLAPSGWKFTLPTEKQWEYAAVGGKKSKGYKYSGSNTLREVGWFEDNSGQTTHPVGMKAPNESGFYDMSGNVSEWCLDDYSYDGSKARPEFVRGNDQDGLGRVLRGGSWNDDARICRAAARNGISLGCSIYDLGFRVALVPERY